MARAVTESQGRQSNARLEARAEIDRIEAAIQAATVVLTVRGLPRTEFQKIAANHPPARNESTDQMLGLNPDTALPELLAASLVEATWEQTG